MMGWLKDWFGPEKPDPKKEMKYIGECTNSYSWEVGGHKHKSTAHILFFMNEYGKRKIVWPQIDTSSNIMANLKAWPTGQACSAWELGGPFPKGFEPHEDVLGDMLVRIVDAKLGLNSKDKEDGEA